MTHRELIGVVFAASVFCFACAAVIDYPAPSPTPHERSWGNFWCSLGWLLLAIAEWGIHF